MKRPRDIAPGIVGRGPAPAFVIMALAITALAGSAAAQAPAAHTPAAPPEARRGMVLMADGSTLNGAVTTLDAKGVSIESWQSGGDPPRTVAWTECVGVVFEGIDGVDGRADADSGGSVATLADGRRLPGRAEANASGMRWMQRWLGAIELPLTGVRWIAFDGEAPVAPLVDADVVRFRTGDRLEGFVSRMADPLMIEPRGAASATQVPLGNVQSVAFVIADVDRDDRLRRVWLLDGTVLDAGAVGFDIGRDAEVSLGGVELAHGRALAVPPEALAAVAGERRGTALSHRPMRTVANDESAALRYEVTPPERLIWPRRRPSRTVAPSSQPPAPPPSPDAAGDMSSAAAGLDDGAWPLGLPSIAFDGPAILRIEIDRPAMLSARLLVPRDRRPRGDFDVVVRSGGRELARSHLDAAHLSIDIAFEVEPPVVEFEIVDTGGGAVQDGLVIERGVLIPRSKEPSASSLGDRIDPPSSR